MSIVEFTAGGMDHVIDLGTVETGDKKGTECTRLSGRKALAYCLTLVDTVSHETLVETMKAVAAFTNSNDARDEQYDALFTAHLDSLRGTTVKVLPRSALATTATMHVATSLGWGMPEFAANSNKVESAFAEFLYAGAAGRLAHEVKRVRGKQNVSLLAAEAV